MALASSLPFLPFEADAPRLHEVVRRVFVCVLIFWVVPCSNLRIHDIVPFPCHPVSACRPWKIPRDGYHGEVIVFDSPTRNLTHIRPHCLFIPFECVPSGEGQVGELPD